MSSKLPPIIYLNCHDAGRLIEPHGFKVGTPHLQSLAQESVFFRNAHCVAPTCSPSRAALLTGCYPHQTGMLGLAHRGYSLNDYSKHLARRLGAMGYHTALGGTQHVGAGSEMIGYDEVFPGAVRNPDLRVWDLANAKAAADYLVRQAEGGGPFYLECGLFYPHRLEKGFFTTLAGFPSLAERSAAAFVMPPSYLPDDEETRVDFLEYQLAMAHTDQCFGLIFDAMRASGLWDRAILIVTTDHGPAFPWAKCNLNDQGTGVFLIMRLPGQQAPMVVDKMVTHLDILPTIYEALGREADASFEGESLLPLLRGEKETVHAQIFSEINDHAAPQPMRSVRTDRYRYVRRFYPDFEGLVLPNIDDSPSLAAIKGALVEKRFPEEELYDLLLDPAERLNLADDPRLEEIRFSLSCELEQWMTRTHDPLCFEVGCDPANRKYAKPV